MMKWLRRLFGSKRFEDHKCNFRQPFRHKKNNRYWMACTVNGCMKVKDSYHWDGTGKIEEVR